jgi:Chitin recognition protein
MRASLLAFSAIIVCFSFIQAVHAQACGKHANETRCADGLCCSQWGYCGSGDEYCSPLQNCQPSYGLCSTLSSITTSDSTAVSEGPAMGPKTLPFYTECGSTGGNQTCPDGGCCSQYGWCGTTAAYCAAASCQAGFGKCWPEDPITATPVETFECGAINGKKCPSGCCSRFGWCGSSAEFCQAETGCQAAFGTCWPEASVTSMPATVSSESSRRVQEDKPCTVSDWTAWSASNDLTLVKVRTRTLQGSPEACQDLEAVQTQQIQPCSYSPWADWSGCDADKCDTTGYQTRIRTLIQGDESCMRVLSQSQECLKSCSRLRRARAE